MGDLRDSAKLPKGVDDCRRECHPTEVDTERHFLKSAAPRF